MEAAGLMGLNLHKQQISVLPKETKTLTAYRGLALMYTDINHGNAIVSINGQLDNKISVIHNGTSGGLMFDDTGGFLNISNEQSGVISIYNNNPEYACNFYMMILGY